MGKKLIDYEKSKERFNELCREKGLTAYMVMEHLGYGSVGAVYKVGSMKNKSYMSLDRVVLFAELVGLPIEEVLVFQEERKPGSKEE